MGVVETTREELKHLFSRNLSDLVRETDVRHHIVLMLDSFAHEKKSLPIREESPDTVVVSKLFENGDYASLMRRGDAYLFLCGWFPDYMSKKRRASLGLDFYIERGVDSYNFALSLIHQKKMGDNPGTVYKLARYFKQNVNALVQLKSRFQGEIIVNPESLQELRQAEAYDDKKITPAYIDSSSLAQRMKERNMRLIK